MDETQPGYYCGGTGSPPTIDGDPGDVLWTCHLCDDGACAGHWHPHSIRNRTDRSVFVSVASGPSPGDGRTARLDREELEREGRVSSRAAYQLFHTPAEMTRLVVERHKARLDARHRGVMAELDAGARRLGLGSRLDFHEVAPGILRMGETHVYAHDGREVACPACDGKGKRGRSKCLSCSGKGARRAMDLYDRANKVPRSGGCLCTTFARDLDDVRDMYARESIGHAGEPAFLLVADFAPMLAGGSLGLGGPSLG